MPDFFICSLVNKEEEAKLNFSFAGNNYQQKVIAAFPFQKVFSFNIYAGRFCKKESGKMSFFLYPPGMLLRVLYLLHFSITISRQIPSDANVVFYNIDTRSVFIYTWLRLLRRSIKRFVIVADYAPPNKGFSHSIFDKCLQNAHGLLSLTLYLKVNANTVYQELLIDNRSKPVNATDTSAFTSGHILFSGSIGKTTGVHIAIAAMQHLPKYQLHISGNMFDMAEAELLEMIKGNSNIHYHGPLSKTEYQKLLGYCQICLSLRDANDTNHLYNFPSKIGEYLYYNKYVISSLSYPGFEPYLHVINWNTQSLIDAIIHPQYLPPAQVWLVQNFGYEKFADNLKYLFSNA